MATLGEALDVAGGVVAEAVRGEKEGNRWVREAEAGVTLV